MTCSNVLSADLSASLAPPVLIPCGLEHGHAGQHRATNTPNFGWAIAVEWTGDAPRVFDLVSLYN